MKNTGCTRSVSILLILFRRVERAQKNGSCHQDQCEAILHASSVTRDVPTDPSMSCLLWRPQGQVNPDGSFRGYQKSTCDSIESVATRCRQGVDRSAPRCSSSSCRSYLCTLQLALLYNNTACTHGDAGASMKPISRAN